MSSSPSSSSARITSPRRSFTWTAMVLLLALLGSTVSPAEANNGYCNVCRDPPLNSPGVRKISNPTHSFQQSNGVIMNCGELETSMEDVRVGPWAAAGEDHMCAVAQWIAYQYCKCSGPSIPGLEDEYQDPAPSCDLCGHPSVENNGVPPPMWEETVDTGVFGRHNCKGLYDAAAEGNIVSSMCPTLQAKAGPHCCDMILQPGKR
mmetsp:Transcript_12077/g.19426  ORF Transcript_12077/g.19426 Transcript_12077/m.19426 type:complete len:205 (+) Transcript_12077:201-815(+)